MDEARIEQVGTAPVRPLLDEIDAVHDAAGVQRMIGRLDDVNIR